MVAELAKALVENPDEVRVEAEDEGATTVLCLYVAEDDLGRVIGRNGRVAHALRALVRGAAGERGARMSLEIVD
jgi:predicted RNA-binding protein YlqC (UPF0109 family)